MSINERRFENGVALVTGRGSRHGIGFATSTLLMKSGAGVAITSTTDRIFKRQASIDEPGSRVVAQTADLARMDQTRTLVEYVIGQFGRIDILVNNAGMSQVGDSEAMIHLDQLSSREWHKSIDRSLAMEEVARDGINVNSVASGWIETASSTDEEKPAGAHTPMGRPGTPQEVADLIAFLVSDEATYITGQTIVIDGGNTIQDYKGPGEGYYS